MLLLKFADYDLKLLRRLILMACTNGFILMACTNGFILMACTNGFPVSILSAGVLSSYLSTLYVNGRYIKSQ
jgi:hypothetical protein